MYSLDITRGMGFLLVKVYYWRRSYIFQASQLGVSLIREGLSPNYQNIEYYIV